MGIIASGVPRENVFLTTKLANDDHGNVEGALETSLQKLNTPYLNLCMSQFTCFGRI
jgi:glycerol 2-dehydrogenase (NADP+)